MGLPVVYRQAARRDIIAAARDYDVQRRGLGAAFFDEIARIEVHISEAPGLYHHVVDGVRRALLRRFPFGLFYLEEDLRQRAANGLTMRRPSSSVMPCCMSSDSTVSQPACSAAAAIIAS